MLRFGGTFYAERTERCLTICPKIKTQYKFLYSLLMKHTPWERKVLGTAEDVRVGNKTGRCRGNAEELQTREGSSWGFGWGVQSNPP